jgi:hypothetical protein
MSCIVECPRDKSIQWFVHVYNLCKTCALQWQSSEIRNILECIGLPLVLWQRRLCFEHVTANRVSCNMFQTYLILNRLDPDYNWDLLDLRQRIDPRYTGTTCTTRFEE